VRWRPGGASVRLELKPDIAVLDTKPPDQNGMEPLRRLIKRLPTVWLLVFPGHGNPIVAWQMPEAGARGFPGDSGRTQTSLLISCRDQKVGQK
jgi:DNA-binding NarL/FixJ family response regulator